MTNRLTAVVPGFLVIVLAAATSGCGGGDPAPAPANPTVAKGFLTQALDAWKSGAPRISLTKTTPSILVNDPDWERKSKLTDYILEGDGEPLGAAVQWTVPLTLSVKGKTVQTKAQYIVNINDKIVTVSRMDADF